MRPGDGHPPSRFEPGHVQADFPWRDADCGGYFVLLPAPRLNGDDDPGAGLLALRDCGWIGHQAVPLGGSTVTSSVMLLPGGWQME